MIGLVPFALLYRYAWIVLLPVEIKFGSEKSRLDFGFGETCSQFYLAIVISLGFISAGELNMLRRLSLQASGMFSDFIPLGESFTLTKDGRSEVVFESSILKPLEFLLPSPVY